MNFTSQICTTKEQSKRLLALGLKRETADMCLQTTLDVCYTMSFQEYIEFFGNRHIPPHPTILPAWSLHRLWQMIPNRYTANDLEYLKIAAYEGIGYELPMKLSAYGTVICPFDNIYDSAIYVIEELIKKGLFNKEYLEE